MICLIDFLQIHDFCQRFVNSPHEEINLNTSPTSFSLHNARGRVTQQWSLSGDALTCSDHASIWLSDITEINLLFVSGGEYGSAHFSCRIYCHNGKTLFLRADVGNVPDVLEYKAFVFALHQTLPAINSSVQYTTGMRSKFGYRLFWWSMLLTFVGVECLVAYAVWHVGKPIVGGLFILVVALLGYGLLWIIQRLLKPGNYDPKAIPTRLLPRT